jgi:hypothetical protein
MTIAICFMTFETRFKNMKDRRTVLASVGTLCTLALAGCVGTNSSGSETPSEDVVSSLDGLRWEMPCEEEDPSGICTAAEDTMTESATVGGTDGTRYAVTLRLRGVVEQMSYEDGTKDGFWYRGGSKAGSSYNVYRLDVSAPEQHFFLNAGESGIERCFGIDYTRTIEMNAGATVRLSADAQDGSLISNRGEDGTPIVVEGVLPASGPYNGQFIQMDVDAVEKASDG